MKILITALLLITLLLSCTSSAPVDAWWCTGHMLIAEVAMQNVNPHVRAVANRHAQYLSQIGPFPQATTATELGCLVDDWKGYKLGMMDEWHFKDIVYNPENSSTTPGWCPIQNDNAASTLPMFFNALNLKGQNSYSAAFAFAFLVHIYGDIHQPLHCATYVAPQFPEGDRGGNSIKMKWNNATVNLHSFWDSICMQPKYADHDRPLNASATQWIHDIAAGLNNTWNNISHYEGSLYNANTMVQQSHQVAVDVVYANITGPDNLTADGVLPQWYQDRCIPVAERQIVLGGMRLAYTLNTLFADAELPPLLNLAGNNSAAPSSSSSSFGTKETGIFFGGFAGAFFCIAVAWLVHALVFKNKNNSNNYRADTTPLVSPADFNEISSQQQQQRQSQKEESVEGKNKGRVSGADVRSSLYDHSA